MVEDVEDEVLTQSPEDTLPSAIKQISPKQWLRSLKDNYLGDKSVVNMVIGNIILILHSVYK